MYFTWWSRYHHNKRRQLTFFPSCSFFFAIRPIRASWNYGVPSQKGCKLEVDGQITSAVGKSFWRKLIFRPLFHQQPWLHQQVYSWTLHMLAYIKFQQVEYRSLRLCGQPKTGFASLHKEFEGSYKVYCWWVQNSSPVLMLLKWLLQHKKKWLQ